MNKKKKKKRKKKKKESHASKGYASYYNAKILNFFNPELQPKNSESAINNELIRLLSELTISRCDARTVSTICWA